MGLFTNPFAQAAFMPISIAGFLAASLLAINYALHPHYQNYRCDFGDIGESVLLKRLAYFVLATGAIMGLFNRLEFLPHYQVVTLARRHKNRSTTIAAGSGSVLYRRIYFNRVAFLYRIPGHPKQGKLLKNWLKWREGPAPVIIRESAYPIVRVLSSATASSSSSSNMMYSPSSRS